MSGPHQNRNTAHTLYFTAATKDAALKISRALVEERLVGCANVCDGVTSVYRWNGELCEDAEVVVFAKTTGTNVAMAMERVRELHDYDCPCVVAWELGAVSPPYLDWLQEQTAVPPNLTP